MILYRVTDWEQNFENNRTRELKHMDWVPIPNKMDGDGYTELLSHPNGAAHFGAWMAIVEIASKCTPRGVLLRSSPKGTSDTAEPRTLLRNGARPHDSRSLSRISRIAEPVFDEVLPRLLSNKWLTSEVIDEKELIEMSHGDAVKPHHAAEKRLWNGREGNNTEGNNTPITPERDCGSAAEPVPASTGFAVKPSELRDEVSTSESCNSSPVSAQKRSKSERKKSSDVPSAARKDADDELPKGFENFWRTWPVHFRKKGRLKCLRIWQRKNLEPLADAIVGSVKSHINCDQWKKDGGQFIPLPASWLNDDAWETPLDFEAGENDFYSPGFVPAPVTPEIIRAALGRNGSEA